MLPRAVLESLPLAVFFVLYNGIDVCKEKCRLLQSGKTKSWDVTLFDGAIVAERCELV